VSTSRGALLILESDVVLLEIVVLSVAIPASGSGSKDSGNCGGWAIPTSPRSCPGAFAGETFRVPAGAV
jgi:hypothetical protein